MTNVELARFDKQSTALFFKYGISENMLRILILSIYRYVFLLCYMLFKSKHYVCLQNKTIKDLSSPSLIPNLDW